MRMPLHWFTDGLNRSDDYLLIWWMIVYQLFGAHGQIIGFTPLDAKLLLAGLHFSHRIIVNFASPSLAVLNIDATEMRISRPYRFSGVSYTLRFISRAQTLFRHSLLTPVKALLSIYYPMIDEPTFRCWLSGDSITPLSLKIQLASLASFSMISISSLRRHYSDTRNTLAKKLFYCMAEIHFLKASRWQYDWVCFWQV